MKLQVQFLRRNTATVAELIQVSFCKVHVSMNVPMDAWLAGQLMTWGDSGRDWLLAADISAAAQPQLTQTKRPPEGGLSSSDE